MTTRIQFDSGAFREPKTRVRTSGVAPASHTMEVYPGEDINSIVRRAYGTNTPQLRDKLTNANAALEGTIHVPR